MLWSPTSAPLTSLLCCAALQVSDSLADQLHDSYTLADVMGSDHCPIGLVVKH
jgi:hypothetical protein